MRINLLKKIGGTCIAVFFLFVSSCQKSSEKKEEQTEFDRKALLENIGNNIIIPRYQKFYENVIKLDSAYKIFNENPGSLTLSGLQTVFHATYDSWQPCSAFEIGYAEAQLLRAQLNTFPTNIELIETSIQSGSFNTNQFAAKGLPALDFLFFGKEGNEKVVELFSTDSNAFNRKDYTTKVIQDIFKHSTAILKDWNSSEGDFLSQFVTATGTDIGSSVGMLINEMNYDLEKILRVYKLGIPLGKFSTTGTITPLPEKAEGIYGMKSLSLMQKQFKALEELYYGGEGVGFDDYLIQIDAKRLDGSLHEAIKNQLNVISVKFESMKDPITDQIAVSNPQLESLFTELQKLVVLWKTDMVTSVGVQITYADTDGD